MVYSQSSPLVEKEWLTVEGTSSSVRARDLHARSEQRIGLSPNKPSIHSSRSLKDGQVARDRPSIGRRIFRTLTRFFIAVLIGVGATLAWQSYGDAAREMLVVRAPTLAALLPVSMSKSPFVAAAPPDPMQQLAPLASNLDVVRRSLELLAAKQEQMAQNQEQMAQNIAALQAVDQDIREKMSSPPSSTAQQATTVPERKPQQPRVQSLSVPRPAPAAGSPSLSR